jgi:hypothetical protein
MRIQYYIQVLALLGAVSCSSSEPSADQSAATELTTDPTTELTTELTTESGAKTAVADGQDKLAMGDTRPEVRYYLLSEK